MKYADKIIFAMTLLLTACGMQTSNSFSGDGNRYGESTVDFSKSSASFAAVRTILKNRCALCHEGFTRYSEPEWVANQYITPGDPEGSTIYRRLRGAKVGGIENMPQGGSLAADELAAFYSWIKNISGDPDTGATNAKSRGEAARSFLATSCTGCHATVKTASSVEYSGTGVPSFLAFTQDNQFVTSGLVVPGNARASWLFRALKKWGDLNRMPLNKSAISESGKKILEDWINGIGQP